MLNSKETIYVIIPVHNRLLKTLRCIKSVFRQKTEERIGVIVVDDGSTDGTSDEIRKTYPSVTVLRTNGTLFWTGSVAHGISHVLQNSECKQDWVVLMNNDVELCDETTFKKLIETFSICGRKSIIAPLTTSRIDGNTTITSGTVIKSWVFNITRHVYNGESAYQHRKAELQRVDLMTARCLVHPIEVFERIGNYDYRRFPHYGGDDEFSARAKRNGYELYVDPKITILLDESIDKIVQKSRGVFFLIFDKRSAINLLTKFRFALHIVPPVARPTYFIVAVVKTLFIILIIKIRSLQMRTK
jgi:GT2 family glycosyltransferase